MMRKSHEPGPSLCHSAVCLIRGQVTARTFLYIYSISRTAAKLIMADYFLPLGGEMNLMAHKDTRKLFFKLSISRKCHSVV